MTQRKGETSEEFNARRRERYARDAEYREKCRDRVRERYTNDEGHREKVLAYQRGYAERQAPFRAGVLARAKELLGGVCASEGCGKAEADLDEPLQFHHRDGGATKSFNVSTHITKLTPSASLKPLLNELIKCELLCRDCHLERHAQ